MNGKSVWFFGMAENLSRKFYKLVRMLSKDGPVRTLDEFRCYWLARETRRIEKDHGLELAKFTELRDLTVEGSNEKFGNPYGPHSTASVSRIT